MFLGKHLCFHFPESGSVCFFITLENTFTGFGLGQTRSKKASETQAKIRETIFQQ